MEQTLIRPYTIERSLSGAKVGNYLLLRELGRGGYAHVYLTEHIYLKHQVALKLLNLSLTQHEDLVRFQFEARLIAQLRHRHIVRALDFGWEGDTPFLAMDYAPGGIIQQAFQRSIPQSLFRILPVVLQVARLGPDRPVQTGLSKSFQEPPRACAVFCRAGCSPLIYRFV